MLARGELVFLTDQMHTQYRKFTCKQIRKSADANKQHSVYEVEYVGLLC